MFGERRKNRFGSVRISFQPHVARLLAVAAIALAVAPELDSESVTLSTYYPAPSGVYTRMITTSDTYLARDGGNVGIGTAQPSAKLDVRGIIRLGPDNATACSASLTGGMRWFVKAGDPNTNTIQVCDGTIWMAVDSHSVASGVCPSPGTTMTTTYNSCSCGYAGSLIWRGTQTSTCTPQPDGTNLWVPTSTNCSPGPPIPC